MKWEVRTPTASDGGLPFPDEIKTFCATTNQGEYTVQRNSEGKFGLCLNDVSLTGYIADSATEIMEAAEDHDKRLVKLMGEDDAD